MSVKLCKWGNSTGLRLSADLMTAAGLKPGDSVTVRLLDSGDIRVRPAKVLQQVEPQVEEPVQESAEELIAKHW
ncbi:MAG: hypothetical protein Q8K29_11080 [Polaromonas sp.]|nr:hypothetical protein [Polaromonas sp.]